MKIQSELHGDMQRPAEMTGPPQQVNYYLCSGEKAATSADSTGTLWIRNTTLCGG
jgi:hypothetical protein